MSRPDLSGLKPSYSVLLTRGVRGLFIGMLVLVSASAVLRLTDDPDGWEIGLSIVQVVCYSTLAWFYLRRPDTVFVLDDGLAFRKALRRRTMVPWREVKEIQVQTRWQDHSSVLLEDGRKLPLVAVPREDAQLLAEALTACR